jgi:hypothetical protein
MSRSRVVPKNCNRKIAQPTRIQGLWESRFHGEPVWRVMPVLFWHTVGNVYRVDESRRFS